MEIKSRFSKIFLSMLMVLLVLGCSRKATYKGPVPTYQKQQVLDALTAHNVDFTWWVAKGKADIQSPEEGGSGKMYLRVHKDTVVWMVAKKLGLEGMRMMIQPDSFWIKYPIDRTYQRGNVDKFLELYELGVDYTDLQQIMAGNVMLPDGEKAIFLQEGTLVQLTYTEGSYSYRYIMHPYTLHLQELLIVDQFGQAVKLLFDDYKEVDTGDYVLPHKREIIISEKASMRFDFSEIQINEAKSTPFSINKRYKEIPL